MTGALSVGTLLAIGALCFVLYPLFFGVPAMRRAAPRAARPATTPREEAVAVLREIEFDRVTGKLADTDYTELKASWTERALVAMRAEDGARASAPAPFDLTAASTDVAELAILRARAMAVTCPVDGPRPEPDARYCGDCGRWLSNECAQCGATVSGEGARFCAECGTALAA